MREVMARIVPGRTATFQRGRIAATAIDAALISAAPESTLAFFSNARVLLEAAELMRRLSSRRLSDRLFSERQ
jgi:hypothetical protein